MNAAEFALLDDESRARTLIDSRVRSALDAALEALKAYVDLVYRLDEAAAENWPTESGPLRPPQSSKSPSRQPGGRLPHLDRYLVRDVVHDLRGLERHADHVSKRIVTLLRGGKPRRISQGVRDEIVERGRKGEGAEEISSTLGVSRSQVRRILVQAD